MKALQSTFCCFSDTLITIISKAVWCMPTFVCVTDHRAHLLCRIVRAPRPPPKGNIYKCVCFVLFCFPHDTSAVQWYLLTLNYSEQQRDVMTLCGPAWLSLKCKFKQVQSHCVPFTLQYHNKGACTAVNSWIWAHDHCPWRSTHWEFREFNEAVRCSYSISP